LQQQLAMRPPLEQIDFDITPALSALLTAGITFVGRADRTTAAATRIIGSTSGAEKARWMQKELGYDAVVTRDGAPICDQLTEAAPDGIDVIVGAVSAGLNPSNATLREPVELDTFQLILRGVTIRGFSADEHAPELFDAWISQAVTWQREGRIHLSRTMCKGLDATPLDLEQACAGHLKGVLLADLESC
jgi:NADPH-dependent curcumin reductase CurA